jgi:hypothetical protein
MTGTITRQELDQMQDRDGVSIAEAMLERGLDPERLDEAQIDPASVHAFVELHIEQGAVLETTGQRDRRRHPHRRTARSAGDVGGLGDACRGDADATAA